MLDIKYIRKNPDIVKQAVQAKSISLSIDELLRLDQELTHCNQKLQVKQRQKNKNAKKFQTALSEKEKSQVAQDGQAISREIQQVKSSRDDVKKQLDILLLKVPNIPSSDSPVGVDDAANRVVKSPEKVKPLSECGRGRSHVELLVQNQWADFLRVARVCGSRSYCLKNEAVFLEQALIQWSMRCLAKKGFELMSLPNFGSYEAFSNSGHFPEGRDQVYYIEKDNTYLSGTSEVILNSLYKNEILPYEKLPLLLAGFSPCFRREAGSAGQDVKGLLRVHQFIKLEQYVICENNVEQSDQWHNFLLKTAEEILQALELPYRVVLISTGDMGAGKYRQHDLECWLPSLNKYVETHSCSSLLGWQARRTGLRYRNQNNEVVYCYTLNNTAIALPRLLAMFLENHQQKNGSIYIPPVLREYLPSSCLSQHFLCSSHKG